MSGLSICTIISKNYLPYARVLAESFLKHNEGNVYVLLVDKVEGRFDPAQEKFDLIEIEDLRSEIPDFDKFCFQYTILELNTAAKPFFLEHLFRKFGMKKLVYLDPDILVTGNLGGLSAILDSHSMVLTPHLTGPIEDDLKPGELDILLAGTYNLGFIALSNTDTTKKHLSWWQERLHDRCIVAQDRGLFVDQKWMDLVPGFYDDIFILREPGYNVAYWNYHCREVRVDGEKITVNGKPSYFFHFSGVDPENLRPVSKYQNRFTLDDLGDVKYLFELYRDLVLARGWEKTKGWRYFYDFFDNGVKIPPFVRRLYLEMGKKALRFGNPYKTEGAASFYCWLNEPVDMKEPVITRLLMKLYRSRPDLMGVFPDVLGVSRERFCIWVIGRGRKDFRIDNKFLWKLLKHAENDKAFMAKAAAHQFIYEIIRLGGMAILPVAKRSQMIKNSLIKINDAMNSFMASKRSGKFLNLPGAGGVLDIKVNLAGYITSESGVGEAARANIRALETVGMPFVLNNIKSLSRQSENTYTNFSDDNPNGINLIHVNADQVTNFFNEKGESYFKNKYNIGFWYWELSKFPKEWLDKFQFFNEIWVASSFCQETLSEASPVPVVKIPPSVVVDRIKNVDRSYFGIKDDSFVFLFIFDLLSFFERKNPLAVIRAFKEAFGPNEKAQLVLKCSNLERNAPARDMILEETKGLNVKLIDRYLDKDEVHALMSISNCYVSLHRSEGFGLPLAESMYLGKPVIATDYSSNTDFMSVNNSFLVKYKLIEIDKDYGPYKKGNVWADPDHVHASELMRLVYEKRELSSEIGAKAARDIRENLSPEATGKKIRERLEHIMRENRIFNGSFI